MVDDFPNFFREGLETIKTLKATLKVKTGSRPRFYKARFVPFALKDLIEEELARMQTLGALKALDHSKWAAPIVPVPKQDGSVRIRWDYRLTVNQILNVDKYSLPKPNELFACLAEGMKFTKLDMSHAYNQLMLDNNSRNFVTINTHKGLFRFKRLPFGVTSAPVILQKTMDQLLQGLPPVSCYIDDILRMSETDE